MRMLYQAETNGEDPGLALKKYCETFPYRQEVMDYTRTLLAGVKERLDVINVCIERASEHWKPERITYVDRNILRLGIWEMLFSPDVPPKVAIDEAIEIGKKYGTEDSREFVNGVLDKVFRDHYDKEAMGEQ